MPQEAAAAVALTDAEGEFGEFQLKRNLFFQDPAKICGKSGIILSVILGFICFALPYLSFYPA